MTNDEAAQSRRESHEQMVKELEREPWIATALPFVKRNIKLALNGAPDTRLGDKR